MEIITVATSEGYWEVYELIYIEHLKQSLDKKHLSKKHQ